MILHTIHTSTVVFSTVSGLTDMLQLFRRRDTKKQKAREPQRLIRNFDLKKALEFAGLWFLISLYSYWTLIFQMVEIYMSDVTGCVRLK